MCLLSKFIILQDFFFFLNVQAIKKYALCQLFILPFFSLLFFSISLDSNLFSNFMKKKKHTEKWQIYCQLYLPFGCMCPWLKVVNWLEISFLFISFRWIMDSFFVIEIWKENILNKNVNFVIFKNIHFAMHSNKRTKLKLLEYF